VQKFVQESWLILMLGIVFAVLLAGAQTGLAPQIETNEKKALTEAIGQVVPNVATTEALTVPGYDRAVYRCSDAQGQFVGWAVDAVGNGFADKIRLVFGLSPDGAQLTGLKVIQNVETPGLGNKIAEDPWAGQYRGLDAGKPVKVEKRPPVAGQNEIQAVTGATISSKAVTDIVNAALERVRPELAKLR
jgi:electron transport complex protein RnfG